MSVKYPNTPSYKERVPKKDYHMINKLFDQYREIHSNLLNEKRELHVEKMVSYDYDSDVIKEKFRKIKVRYDKNEHDEHFLENYPAFAIRHAKGESWGTTSPR